MKYNTVSETQHSYVLTSQQILNKIIIKKKQKTNSRTSFVYCNVSDFVLTLASIYSPKEDKRLATC